MRVREQREPDLRNCSGKAEWLEMEGRTTCRVCSPPLPSTQGASACLQVKCPLARQQFLYSKQCPSENPSTSLSSKNDFWTQACLLLLSRVNPGLHNKPAIFLTGRPWQQRLTRTSREKWTSWLSWGHGTPGASWTPRAPRSWMCNGTWV